jgi:3-hydroxyacyl-CoA dehydrogenase
VELQGFVEDTGMSEPVTVRGREVDSIAVIGTGFIGMGWAITFARAGITVRAHDSDPAALAQLPSRVERATARMERAGWINASAGNALRERIRCCEALDETLNSVQYAQESVPEDLALKQATLHQLDRRLPPEVIIGSSTSGLPMTRIAEHTSHPERCVVAHPTNPPHIVPLVEIVPGERTAAETTTFVRALMEAIGQSPIVCHKEVPGFVLNRLQMALEREAFALARAGVASVADIDRTISEGLGLRWSLLGPFLVEETNANDIRDDLTKFGPALNELFADVCGPFGGLGPDDVDRAEEGVRELMSGRSHDDLIAYRDELVLRIRALKREYS